MIDSGNIISTEFRIQSRCLFGGLSEICPLFFPDRQFSHLNPQMVYTSEKFQNYFFKISLQLPPSVFRLVFISGLGLKIGPRQQKLWRTPNLSSLANPAVGKNLANKAVLDLIRHFIFKADGLYRFVRRIPHKGTLSFQEGCYWLFPTSKEVSPR